MRIRQYVYFDLSSETVTADAIKAQLGVEPDELRVRGSRRVSPTVVPVHHAWSIRCDRRGLALDDQARRVLNRLLPIRTKLIDLVPNDVVSARLVIVRYLDDEDGEDETLEPVTTPDGRQLAHLSGQHQLLGWNLTAEELGFLASIRAAIWADEYG